MYYQQHCKVRASMGITGLNVIRRNWITPDQYPLKKTACKYWSRIYRSCICHTAWICRPL